MIARRTIRIALACGLAAFGAGAGTAVAQEGVAIKNLLGNMGLIPPDKDPIRYRERAPLVLPPKGELPAPAAGSYASASPEWPNDPDVAAVRRRSAEERKPMLDSEVRRMNETNPRLTNQELGRGRIANTASGVVPGSPSHFGDNSKEGLYLSPDQMRALSKRSGDDDKATPGAEPARRVLTEPPSGMRRSARNQTISPTYDPRVDQQEIDASPLNWLKRKFSSDSDD